MTSTQTRALPRALATSALLCVLAALAGCSKPPLPGDLKVGEITTGRTLAADGAIVEDARTTMFWTTDTFFVTVETEGSAENVSLQARWTGPDGKVAAESSKTLSPTGKTITTFEATPSQDNEGRWPAGDYKLEILVNGSSQASRELNAR
jgi:hypothetical protein